MARIVADEEWVDENAIIADAIDAPPKKNA
jgi:hypothetical protein